MRISDLVKKLEDYQKEYGDIQVEVGKVFKKGLFPDMKHKPIEGSTVIMNVETLKDRQVFNTKVVVF